MALTVDWTNKIIDSDASITDLVAFHAALRDLEDDPAEGAIYKPTHTWKALDLGGGGYFYQADLINGYQLRFASAGTYEINGNLKGTLILGTGVAVERTTSAAFVTHEVSTGSGLSTEQATQLQAVFDMLNDIEGTLTHQEVMRVLLSAMTGRVSGAGTSQVKFRDLANSKDRITAEVDAQGNRTGISLDVS